MRGTLARPRQIVAHEACVADAGRLCLLVVFVEGAAALGQGIPIVVLFALTRVVHHDLVGGTDAVRAVHYEAGLADAGAVGGLLV